ncbi:prolyl 4-hydroxylase subunit alpha, putative [Plasmodium chabaudi chabaudi]|uniref:Prolyl 4-hydroxylase subunit alpha, putative n=1 Tax=Plasmodium chabaudi chabaudi TaxID=31271 RepID=A0A1D3RWX8_PLACU|nr:prolyl 4-hydroxylase subunit alpha, putative [Plasmodium chabaudi chabaudi]
MIEKNKMNIEQTGSNKFSFGEKNEDNLTIQKTKNIFNPINQTKIIENVEKNRFGIKLYDNNLEHNDNIETIIKKVINEKNIYFYKKYPSYLLYLSDEIDEENGQNANNLNDNYKIQDNKKIFFKIQIIPNNMAIIYNIVPKNVIEKILSMCENKYKKSKTSIGYSNDKQENYKLTNSINRTSSTVFLYTIRNKSMIQETHIDNDSTIIYTKDQSIIELENTICDLVKIPLCYLEPLAIVKYEQNNYFNLHHDGSFRRATLLIYLNDVNKDGETTFPYYNLSIKPIQGSGIFWYNIIPIEDDYAIHYCTNRIKQFYQNLKKNTHLQPNSHITTKKDTTLIEDDLQTMHYNKSSVNTDTTINSHCNFNDNTQDTCSPLYSNNLSDLNNFSINGTKDLIQFLKNKSNLQKFSIDLVNDEFGYMYITDMTMLHQANKVTNEYKYVINCFFNINVVRNV